MFIDLLCFISICMRELLLFLFYTLYYSTFTKKLPLAASPVSTVAVMEMPSLMLLEIARKSFVSANCTSQQQSTLDTLHSTLYSLSLIRQIWHHFYMFSYEYCVPSITIICILCWDDSSTVDINLHFNGNCINEWRLSIMEKAYICHVTFKNFFSFWCNKFKLILILLNLFSLFEYSLPLSLLVVYLKRKNHEQIRWQDHYFEWTFCHHHVPVCSSALRIICVIFAA